MVKSLLIAEHSAMSARLYAPSTGERRGPAASAVGHNNYVDSKNFRFSAFVDIMPDRRQAGDCLCEIAKTAALSHGPTRHVLAVFRPSRGHHPRVGRKEMSAQVVEKSRFAEENGVYFSRFSAENRSKMLRFRPERPRMNPKS